MGVEREINFSQGILEDIVFQLKKKRIVVRTLSLRSMASAAQGSRQAFQYQAWFPSSWVGFKSKWTTVGHHQCVGGISFTFMGILPCW